MQKLSGTSSGKNNKGCGVFHHESKTNGFAFFCFFYDFSRNLQATAKALLLFELPFRSEALGNIFCFAMWPLGRPAGAVGANSSEARRSLAGEVRDEGLEVTRVRFVA
jgi:hypothetical protein